jgi:hypothetical protein
MASKRRTFSNCSMASSQGVMPVELTKNQSAVPSLTISYAHAANSCLDTSSSCYHPSFRSSFGGRESYVTQISLIWCLSRKIEGSSKATRGNGYHQTPLSEAMTWPSSLSVKPGPNAASSTSSHANVPKFAARTIFSRPTSGPAMV